MRKYLLIFLAIFPAIFFILESCYLFRIHREFPIKKEDLSLIKEVLEMEPRLLELTNIMQLEKENLSDYTKLIFNACKEYGLAFFHLSFEEVYRKGYISTIFFRNFHDSCLSSFNCSITSTISLFETLPSSKEYYDLFMNFQSFGSKVDLTNVFHIFIVNFHKHLSLLISTGEELYA